jgi:hypothetical protein
MAASSVSIYSSARDYGDMHYCRHTVCRDNAGYLHAVWCQKTASQTSYWQVLYSKSTDGGATWAAATELTNAAYNHRQACVACDSNDYIYVHYRKDTSPIRTCYRKWSGSSWDSEANMGYSASYDRTSSLVVVDASDRIWMFFAGIVTFFTVMERHSDNGGSSWTSETEIISRDGSDQYDFPTADIDSSRNVHLSYVMITGTRVIKYQKYTHDTSWGSKETSLSDASYTTWLASTAVDSSDIPHVAGYRVQASGGTDIRYRNRSGGSWGTDTKMNDSSTAIAHHIPMLVFNTNDDIFCVWRYNSSPVVWYYKEYTGSWGSQTNWTPADAVTAVGYFGAIGARSSGKDIPSQGFGLIWNRTNSGTYYCMWYGSDGLLFLLTKNLSETLALSDTIINTAEKVLSETLGLSDSISYISQMYRTLTETIHIDDTISYFKGMMTFLYETIGISDSITKNTSKMLSESLQLSDAISLSSLRYISLSETLHFEDSMSYLKTIQKTLSETIGISDSFSKVAQFYRVLDETLDIKDELPFPSAILAEYIKIMANLKKYKLRDFTLKIDPDASSILSGDLDEELEEN